MNTVAQLSQFLMGLHRHPPTMGARMAFALTGAILIIEGIQMIIGSFARPYKVQERTWRQRWYPPFLPEPFDYPVRAFYAFVGVAMISIGLPLLVELFV
jgi:uncharacterized membrane protein HdeD (DUF308 family)